MNKRTALNPPYCLDEFNPLESFGRAASPGSQYPDSKLCHFPMPFFTSRRQIHPPVNFRLKPRSHQLNNWL